MNREAEQALRAVAENFAASREDLERIAESLGASPVPTLGEFAPIATGLLTGRTLDTYRHHIDRLAAQFSDRRMDDVSLLELERAAIEVRADAIARRGSSHGFGAQESVHGLGEAQLAMTGFDEGRGYAAGERAIITERSVVGRGAPARVRAGARAAERPPAPPPTTRSWSVMCSEPTRG